MFLNIPEVSVGESINRTVCQRFLFLHWYKHTYYSDKLPEFMGQHNKPKSSLVWGDFLFKTPVL
jgi:hypothetical protein